MVLKHLVFTTSLTQPLLYGLDSFCLFFGEEESYALKPGLFVNNPLHTTCKRFDSYRVFCHTTLLVTIKDRHLLYICLIHPSQLKLKSVFSVEYVYKTLQRHDCNRYQQHVGEEPEEARTNHPSSN